MYFFHVQLKDAGMLCVKKSRGFCQACMKIVMLIENNEKGNKEEPVDFDDKSSWEYLFKDYWVEVKARFSLSLTDLIQNKNSRNGPELDNKHESPSKLFNAKDHEVSGSDNFSKNNEASKKKRIKAKKKKSTSKKGEEKGKGNSKPANTGWGTEELLEFVMHMRNGERSVASQYDVQGLLLEYIQINDLRDRNCKSQIICDSRLENLFGKKRVGHFEMLKLLESHFLIKKDSQIDDAQGTVVATEAIQMDDDDETLESNTKGSSKSRKRKARKKEYGRGSLYNRGEYAAIDIHNISLIYLRRKLVEDLIIDTEKFRDKVVGTFVRIRISGTNQKQDLYRLVQVVGTSKAAKPYKIGEPFKIGQRTVDIMLEVINLNKTEVISVDTISNQEFTEDECKRLRQSIKCGLVKRLTVGDILDKAMELQATRVNDWLETEISRLSHLCDRASDMGHRKELRECVEKIKLLKTPEERLRRLEEVPTINADPNMDPSYVSDDDTDMEENKQEIYMRPRNSSFNIRGSDPVSPGRGDSWSGTNKNVSKNWDGSINLSSKGISTKAEDDAPSYEKPNENLLNQGSVKIRQQANNIEKPSSSTYSEAPPPSTSPVPIETNVSINEADKMWHYKDPAGKIQGPFSLVQLRKWNNNGYFPNDLRIWRVTDKEDDGLLLTDALAIKFAFMKQSKECLETSSGQQTSRGLILTTPLVETPKLSSVGRNDSMNLTSPTPQQSTSSLVKGEMVLCKRASSLPSGDGGLQSPTPDSSLQNPSGGTVPDTSGALGTSIPTLHDSSDTFGAKLNSDQGVIAGSANLLQISQSGDQVPAPDNNHKAAHMVQSIPGQNSNVSHGWGGAPTPIFQPNSSLNVGGQMVAYNQWTGVPSMVQNPSGNVPQPNPWGQASVPINQPQPQPLLNLTWGAMHGNPNMGWLGNAPGNPNMNWGAMIPGNANPTWFMPAGGNVQVQGPVYGDMSGGWIAPLNQGWVATPSGNPGEQMQGIQPYNQGWVTAPTQGPVVPMNGNPGWGMLTGNQGGISPQGWGLPSGNQGAPVQGPTFGNVNQGWGFPAAAGNQNSDKQRNGDGFSGQRGRGSQRGDRGRPSKWDNRGRDRNRDGDRPSSFGRGGPNGDSKSNEPTVYP